MFRKRGFTLIELLIVVAIIAILAAIAVPNFLEAQVRSKISRVKADMRSLQLACEAYRIDGNSYPLDNIKRNNVVLPDMTSWCMLTTPIAYMSSVPTTPFREYKTENCVPAYTGTDKNPGNYLEYWGGGFNASGQYVVTAGSRETGIFWRASSVGPDNISDFHNQFGTQPGASISPIDIKNRNPNLVKCIYDATNGTTSKGDIFISNQGFM